jgi:hypothetical protein
VAVINDYSVVPVLFHQVALGAVHNYIEVEAAPVVATIDDYIQCGLPRRVPVLFHQVALGAVHNYLEVEAAPVVAVVDDYSVVYHTESKYYFFRWL